MSAQLAVLSTEDNEQPTKKIENISSRVLGALAHIDRLAELAHEKIVVDPDGDALASAAADLATIRSLVRRAVSS